VKNARSQMIGEIASSKALSEPQKQSVENLEQTFGANIFSENEMRKRLPKNVFKAVRRTIRNGEKLDPGISDVVAQAMKNWALEKGAAHYAHVFYPLTGLTAEKHDSFFLQTVLAGRWRNFPENS